MSHGIPLNTDEL